MGYTHVVGDKIRLHVVWCNLSVPSILDILRTYGLALRRARPRGTMRSRLANKPLK